MGAVRAKQSRGHTRTGGYQQRWVGRCRYHEMTVGGGWWAVWRGMGAGRGGGVQQLVGRVRRTHLVDCCWCFAPRPAAVLNEQAEHPEEHHHTVPCSYPVDHLVVAATVRGRGGAAAAGAASMSISPRIRSRSADKIETVSTTLPLGAPFLPEPPLEPPPPRRRRLSACLLGNPTQVDAQRAMPTGSLRFGPGALLGRQMVGGKQRKSSGVIMKSGSRFVGYQACRPREFARPTIA